MNMQQVASAYPRDHKNQLHVHVQMFAEKHKTEEFTVIIWYFPKISSALSPECVHDHCRAKEAAPGSGHRNIKEVLNTRR